MILNVRGAGGSGKSHIAHTLIDRFEAVPHRDAAGEISSYEIGNALGGPSLFILGPYENDCGGCDRLTGRKGGSDFVEQMVEWLAKSGHVLFEGKMICTLERWITFARRHPDFVIGFMETSLQRCIERVYERNGGKAFNLPRITEAHRLFSRQRAQFREARVPIFELGTDSAVEDVLEILSTVGFDPHPRTTVRSVQEGIQWS